MKKRVFCFITAIVMLVSMLPTYAFAADGYKITCNGCAASLDISNLEDVTTIDSAEAGTTVYLVPQIAKTSYLIEFTADEKDVEINGDSFVMPAHDVTIRTLTGEKKNIEFDLTNGQCAVTPVMLATLMDYLPRIENKDEFDLDENGVGDVSYSATENKLYDIQDENNRMKSFTKTLPGPYDELGEIKFVFTKSSEQQETYTVIWKLDDGRELARAEGVTKGSVVNYPETPKKPSTLEYDYTFIGWSPQEGEINGDTVYTANFEAKERYRTITWLNYDKTVLQRVTIRTTESASYTGKTPTRPSNGKVTYTFNGWQSVINNTTGDTVYTAIYKSKAIPISLSAKNKTFKSKTKTKKYSVTLKIGGKGAKHKKLTLKVNNKTYTAKTNAKGVAIFKLKKLTRKGTFKAIVSYKGNPKNISKKVKIKVK